jgi:hypothetical protein
MRTIAHLYEYYSDAAAAVGDLEKAGIPHKDISIISSDTAATQSDPDVTPAGAGAATGETVGAILGGGTGLLAGLGVLAIPGIGPVLAAGWLVAVITGAGVGAAAGSLLGALLGTGIESERAQLFAEGIRRGGALVTVRIADSKYDTAQGILENHGPIDPIVQEKLFRQSGWTP